MFGIFILVVVQDSFKKFCLNEKIQPEFLFPCIFEAVLYIFRKQYPDYEMIANGNEKNTKESGTEYDTNFN